jgi:hypothetical protein
MTWSMLVGALQDRLLDYDDKVRVAVVKAIYDLAKADPKSISTDLLRKGAERLRDKKVHGRGLMTHICERSCLAQGVQHSDHLV